MPTKTFHLNIVDGHPLIEDGGNIILIDTGSPATIHIQRTLNFMDSEFPVNQAYGSVTIPVLCELLGTRVTTLLGMDRLADYKIIFDYPNSKITFSNDKNLQFEGERVGLRTKLNIPVIDAIINQHTIPCFLDSGAKLSYLKVAETRNFKNLGNREDFYLGAGRFQTPILKIETQVGTRIFPVYFGNLPPGLENQLLTLVDGNNGILGNDFLSKYKIYLDVALKELKIADSSPDDKQKTDDSGNKMSDLKKMNIMANKPEIIKGPYKKVAIDAAFKGRNRHLVFVADSGPSMYMNHVSGAGGLSYDEAARQANIVNRGNETGTLYPAGYSVTIVPLSVFGTRDNRGNRDLMRGHIKDVFLANENYIQSTDIFFCFEQRADFDYQLAIDTIYEEAERTYQFVQRISIL
jgi:hypothetical protein